MDPLSALLDGDDRAVDIRVRAPWSIDLGVGDGFDLVAVGQGTVWCHRSGGAEALKVDTGDLLVLRRTGHARMLSDDPANSQIPATGPRGSQTPVVHGERGTDGARLFLRSFSLRDQTFSAFLTGMANERVITTARDSHLWSMLLEEADHVSVATASAVTRIVDLILIDALRRWVADGDSVGWMRAVLDPIVGEALRYFHGEPAHPWTLGELAERVGTTRSSLSRRFQLLVGEPPMTYLRHWRLMRAATLLDEDGLTVAAAARMSGFSDPFEFSAAFSKEFGVAPGRYRAHTSAGSA